MAVGSACFRRFGAATVSLLIGAAVLVVTGGEVVAAVPPKASVQVFVLESGMSDGLGPTSAGKPMPVWMDNFSGVVARGVVVTIDMTMAGVLTAQVPDAPHPCTRMSAKLVCPIGDVAPDVLARRAFTLVLRVAAGADVPAGANIYITATGRNADTSLGGASIDVIPTPVDLVVPVNLQRNIAPGGTARIPVVVRNQGTGPAHGLVLEFDAGNPAYVRLIHRYPDCVYDDSNDSAICDFPDLVLQPGMAYLADRPFDLAIGSRVPGPFLLFGSYQAWTADTVPDAVRARLAEAHLPVPTMQPGASVGEADPNDNSGTFALLTRPHAADLAATGTSLAVEPGTAVPLQVGVTNHGPADALVAPGWNLFGYGAGSAGTVDVTAPAGGMFTSAPAACAPYVGGVVDWDKAGVGGYPRYACHIGAQTGALVVGSTERFAFTLRVGPTAGADGSVIVRTAGFPDPDTANTRAAIHLNLPGSGVNPAPAGGGPVAGTLPATGSRTGVLGGFGAALLAAGAILMLVARRRRVADLAPDGDS